MTGEYIIYAPYGNDGSSNEVLEHFRLPPSPSGTATTPYTSSAGFSHMPLGHNLDTHTGAVNGVVYQASPQTKVMSTQQPWTSPGRHFRPILPRPETFMHSPRSNPTLQHLDTQSNQSSSGPGVPTTPVAHSALYPNNTYIAKRSGVQHTTNYDRHTQELDKPFPQSEYLTPSLQTPSPPQSRWQQAREYRRKVYEPPYLDPHTDDTIAFVEANAELWVTQLILAMSNTKDVKDTPQSHHRRLFLSEDIDPFLIEACCREIFTALIDRCKHGFRGPAPFNKTLKASHQLEADRTGTCEERMQNVVKVLSWNKRACKDVLYEDWKIRLLVNHPLSYDKEKDSQKGSNDQRRRRQLAEREKMEKTEEELRAYREAHGEGGVGDKGAVQFNDAFAYRGQARPEWLYNTHDVGLGTSLGKRSAFEDTVGNDAKRQRV